MKNEDYDKGYRKGHETVKECETRKNLGKAVVYGLLAVVTFAAAVVLGGANSGSDDMGAQNG